MSFARVGGQSGFISQEWYMRQKSPLGKNHIVNEYLAPLIPTPKPFFLSEGIFVSTRIRDGHVYYDPTCHGDYRYIYRQSADVTEHLKSAAYILAGSDTYSLVTVGCNTHQAVNLTQNCLYESAVVHTGTERIYPGDIFIVEPPTEEDSKAQIEALSRNVRASSFQKEKSIVGGFLATHKIGPDLTAFVSMMCQRDLRSLEAYAEHAERVRMHDSSETFLPNLGCASSAYMFMNMAMQTFTMAAALHNILQTNDELSTMLLNAWKAKHNLVTAEERNLLYPSPSNIAVVLGKIPEVRNFLTVGTENAMDLLNTLTKATYGRMNRAAFQNPENDRGITMNATDGYCVTGDVMKVSMIAINGFQ